MLIDPLLLQHSDEPGPAHPRSWSPRPTNCRPAVQPGLPKQLGEILFDKLGLPKVVKKTATGARPHRRRRCWKSWPKTTRCRAAPGIPQPGQAQEHLHRQAAADGQPAHRPRAHHYAQAVAVTGRLSSNDPNLQNIPIRTAEGRRIRGLHRPGRPQASSRPTTRRSSCASWPTCRGDAWLAAPSPPGETYHRATAAECSASRPDRGDERAAPLRQGHQLRPDLRHERLRPGQNLGIERQARAELHRPLLPVIPGVASLHGRTRAAAKPQGYVETVFGRRLWPEIRPPTARAVPPNAPPSTRPCRAPPPT